MLFGTVGGKREGNMNETLKEQIKKIADGFDFTGELVSCRPAEAGISMEPIF